MSGENIWTLVYDEMVMWSEISRLRVIIRDRYPWGNTKFGKDQSEFRCICRSVPGTANPLSDHMSWRKSVVGRDGRTPFQLSGRQRNVRSWDYTVMPKTMDPPIVEAVYDTRWMTDSSLSPSWLFLMLASSLKNHIDPGLAPEPHQKSISCFRQYHLAEHIANSNVVFRIFFNRDVWNSFFLMELSLKTTEGTQLCNNCHRALIEVWEDLDQKLINNLIDSMTKRIRLLIQKRGDRILYSINVSILPIRLPKTIDPRSKLFELIWKRIGTWRVHRFWHHCRMPVSTFFSGSWTEYYEFIINLLNFWEYFRTCGGFASPSCRKVRVNWDGIPSLVWLV
jgi:hypothetical protein